MKDYSNVKICPICNNRTMVCDTRIKDDKLIRLRECTVCNNVFKTIEIFENELPTENSIDSYHRSINQKPSQTISR